MIGLSGRPSPTDKQLCIGFDVGSTTVKFVVLDACTGDLLSSEYQRHGARQAQAMAQGFLQPECANLFAAFDAPTGLLDYLEANI